MPAEAITRRLPPTSETLTRFDPASSFLFAFPSREEPSSSELEEPKGKVAARVKREEENGEGGLPLISNCDALQ